MKLGELQDEDVVRLIQQGEIKLFTDLVKKYDKALLRLAIRHVRDQELAKDIVQEAFFKAYQHINSFEFRCSFKNWLYKIAVNTTRNKIRSLREMESIEELVIVEFCQVEGKLMYDELKDVLVTLINRLPEKQKKTLELRVFQDMSFKEVASLMNCPYDTAKANYRHAMLKLKEYFKDRSNHFEHTA